MIKKEIYARMKENLGAVYHERLRGVVLYGSEARGDARPGSDIDLLVLLDGPVALGRELKSIVGALYPLQLEIERPIHAFPLDVKTFEAQEFPLYRNVKNEGVFL